jgi:hypothetical protein
MVCCDPNPRENTHAWNEVDEVVRRDLELIEHGRGGCAFHRNAYGGTGAGGACGNSMHCCLEFDRDLYGGQRRQRKRHQLQGQLVDAGQ